MTEFEDCTHEYPILSLGRCSRCFRHPTEPKTEGRVIPDSEVHDRWCNVIEAMEAGSVERFEDDGEVTPGKWAFGVCLHGIECLIDLNEPASKRGRPKACRHPLRERSKITGKCKACQRDRARKSRQAHRV